MRTGSLTLLDLDHVVTNDGRIYRVLGNLDSQAHFLGYNVYSPNPVGDRLYRGKRYTKNFIEDDNLPPDVLDSYELIGTNQVIEHHDPVRSAKLNNASFQSTVWHDLYTELCHVFGSESVGIFGSSMFGLHLTPEGKVRKDVDFVIHGLSRVGELRQRLPEIRDRLGFTDITAERQLRQYARYRRVFRNDNNSIRTIIARRWTGLQLSEQIVTTIRLRDSAQAMPVQLVATLARDCKDIIVSGRVVDADSSNLFPRRFTLVTDHGATEIYILWWKFSTPVRDGDVITVCGSLLTLKDSPVIRLTDFTRHWLRITD
jgi:predicted nucleotidyltransferase